ncbi:TlpA family protein disulfide reductase [Hyunsoonleella aestuarii]|uniref:Thioredoxin family protein n=1 Tax=Hyunsoonleella aestuarii TaxID=912802 RepID=A0ABP8EDD3_9FLAO|nr:hypothetical protein [Hyunsoonleella aestuarii]
MKLYFALLLSILAFVGCKKESNSIDKNYAFLGGQIINPKNNFVVVAKPETIQDTIILDGNNRFLYKIENLTEGLYTFRHGDEFQMVLLESQDSLLLRLNTLDFDESLVYSGRGAKKNNYFIDEFLQNEKQEKSVFKYCQLEAKDFEKKIEYIKSKKLKHLDHFKSKYETSTLFNKLAKANIDYNYYFNKEIYPFVHYGKNKAEILASLPSGFYEYRKNVNYNDDFLKDYFSYQSFLKSNFNNLALKEHLEHSKKDYFDSKSVCFTLDKLKLIDSLVDKSSIKNDLLYHYTINFLTKNKSESCSEAVLKSFLAKSDNKEQNDLIKHYSLAIYKLKKGKILPEVAIIDCKNNEYDLNAVINTPTVFCFWSHSIYSHFKDTHKKLEELKLKYPEVSFVTVNIDNYDLKMMTKTLKRNKLSCKDKYQLKNPEESKEVLALYPITKAIIVDKNKKIIDSNTNIFYSNFEEQLLGLLNK